MLGSLHVVSARKNLCSTESILDSACSTFIVPLMLPCALYVLCDVILMDLKFVKMAERLPR